MLHLTPIQWAMATVGALTVGLAKTGIAGLGIFSAVIFALAFPPKLSVGIILPILISADIVAVSSYRRHANWSHLRRLFPWAAVGILLGFLTLHHVNDAQVAHFIGILSIALIALQVWRRHVARTNPEAADSVPHQWWFAATLGVLAGFTTMVANAAGPIMVLYLLASGLPKMEFMGTGAWFFLCVNSFKVPFMVNLHMINTHSLPIDAVFIPLAVLGALVGRIVLARIKQSVFENLAMVLTVIAGLELLIKH